MNVRTKPKPLCPECDEPMVLRTRRSDQKQFWGCSDWPNCEGTRNIKSDGSPEDDDDIFEDWEKYDGDDYHPGHPIHYGDK